MSILGGERSGDVAARGRVAEPLRGPGDDERRTLAPVQGPRRRLRAPPGLPLVISRIRLPGYFWASPGTSGKSYLMYVRLVPQANGYSEKYFKNLPDRVSFNRGHEAAAASSCAPPPQVLSLDPALGLLDAALALLRRALSYTAGSRANYENETRNRKTKHENDCVVSFPRGRLP